MFPWLSCITQSLDVVNFHGHLDDSKCFLWKFQSSFYINQSFDVGNFNGHFGSSPDSAYGNFHRHLYQPKFLRWKFPPSFSLNWIEMLTMEISMVVCITPRKFWTWKFPRLFWINSKVLTLEISIANLRCIGIRCSANPRLFFYIKSIHLLQFGNIFDISLYFWHEFFFLAIIVVNPGFLANPFMQKKHVCKQFLAPFTTPSKNCQFWQSFLIILPRYTKRKVVKNSIY